MELKWPYIYRWERLGRKGQLCRVTARGRMNSICVEFEDGFTMITSGNAIRKAHANVATKSQPRRKQNLPPISMNIDVFTYENVKSK
jgi:hypothetical protein